METERRPRLGRIERHLVIYAIRQKKPKLDYVSRWAALRLFVVGGSEPPRMQEIDLLEDDGWHTRLRRERFSFFRKPARTLSAKQYASLQVRFSRALRRLEAKGLIETRVGYTGVVVDEEGQAAEAALGYEAIGRLLGKYVPPPTLPKGWSVVHGETIKNRSAYRLTTLGRTYAWKLYKNWLRS